MADTFLDRQIAVLMKEWDLCETGIGRYDTLSSSTRTWAITIFGAMLAASGGRWYIVAAAIVPTFLLLFIDALNKTIQGVFISRSGEIQEYLNSETFRIDCTSGALSFETPRLSFKFWQANNSWFADTLVEATQNVTVSLLYLVMIAASVLLSAIFFFSPPLPH